MKSHIYIKLIQDAELKNTYAIFNVEAEIRKVLESLNDADIDEELVPLSYEFHSGLNAVVGDEIASNSIGKSTMLMIIDFVFGGEDYIKKNHDTVDQLGHHDFRFVFEFLDKEYFFVRSTNEYKSVSIFRILISNVFKKLMGFIKQ